jgi:hypothetical protein
MQKVFLYTLIALSIAHEAHAAGGPEAEVADLDQNSVALFQEAVAAMSDKNFPKFQFLLAQNPHLTDFKIGPETDLLSIAITGQCSKKPKIYTSHLMAMAKQIEPYHLKISLSWACTSICLDHPNEMFDTRLATIKSIFDLVENKPLAPHAITPTILTPRDFMRRYALNFLESKGCGRCKEPWCEHRPIDQVRMKQLREALQLTDK